MSKKTKAYGLTIVGTVITHFWCEANPDKLIHLQYAIYGMLLYLVIRYDQNHK